MGVGGTRLDSGNRSNSRELKDNRKQMTIAIESRGGANDSIWFRECLPWVQRELDNNVRCEGDTGRHCMQVFVHCCSSPLLPGWGHSVQDCVYRWDSVYHLGSTVLAYFCSGQGWERAVILISMAALVCIRY